MRKYRSYSLFVQVCSFLGMVLGFWMFYGTLTGIVKAENTNKFIEFFGLCWFIFCLYFWLCSLNKIVVTDEYISRRIYLIRKKKMQFSDIERYEISINRTFLILYSKNQKIAISVCDNKFCMDFSVVLRKLFDEDIKDSLNSIKENGLKVMSLKYEVKIDGEGIKNLRTAQEFKWDEIYCSKKKTKNGCSYKFKIDAEIKLRFEKAQFCFDYEDFFEEMTKRCKAWN